MMTTNNGHKQCYDKIAYRFMCKKPHKKLSVHLKQHPNNTLVAEMLALPPKSRKRSNLITGARNLGNHRHNVEVLKEGKGEIIVVQRPTRPEDSSHYSPCVQCAVFKKRNVETHLL